MSGTQRACRYGVIAMADDHPNRSANEAAIVRRSVVRATSPMRRSSAWNGPAPASRRSVPSIHTDSGVVIGSLAAHANNTSPETCTGGQGTVPNEQNTQQSPGLGRSSVWQAVHS